MATIYNSYAAYNRAVAAGRKNIKFISTPEFYVSTQVDDTPPSFVDDGMSAAAMQSGDY